MDAALRCAAALIAAMAIAAAAIAAEEPPAAANAAPSTDVQTYKLNYFLPYTKDRLITGSDPSANRIAREIKFQISFEKRLFEPWPVYIGYTQRSMWQYYDVEHSRPFRESNYNPEIFALVPSVDFAGKWSLGGQIGIEHESNGRGTEIVNGVPVALSRSWNRYYGWPYLAIQGEFPLVVSIKWWRRMKEKPEDDDNPEIEDYLGRAELHVIASLPCDFLVTYLFRKGRKDVDGTTELNVMGHVPYLADKVYLQLHYFHGVGETLIDFNRNVNRWGIGFAFGDPRRHYGATQSPSVWRCPWTHGP